MEWVLDGGFGAFEGDVCGVGDCWRVFRVLEGVYGY